MIVHLDDGKANALSFEVIAAVNEAIGEAEADESVGALVITWSTRSILRRVRPRGDVR